MSFQNGLRVEKGYATVVENGGIDYRDIADTMTELGYSMNHSSARNHVLRIMRKFAEAIVDNYDQVNVDDSSLDAIARSPNFQDGVADLLHAIESERRDRRTTDTYDPKGRDL